MVIKMAQSMRFTELGCLLVLGCLPYLIAGETTYYVSMLGRDISTISQTTTPLYLMINNQNDDPITVTLSGSNCDQVGDRTIASSKSAPPETLRVNCTGLVPTGIEIAPKGLKVFSSDDFLLHVIQEDEALQDPVGREGYLAFKQDHLGNEYRVITYCQTGGWCQFSILATEDASINVRFPRQFSGNATCSSNSGSDDFVPVGTSIPFSLSAMDILHIESQQDLSGTYISSDQTIAVFAGARDVPAFNTSKVGHFVEQLLPINKWGQSYLVMPNDHNDNGDVINIITKSDNTSIEILGFSPFVVPYAGDSSIRRIDWGLPAYIVSDKPIAIGQFMFINLYNNGDATKLPSMILALATNQWASENYFYAYPGFFSSPPEMHVSVSSNNTLNVDAIVGASGGTYFASSDTIVHRTDATVGHKTLNGFVRIQGGDAAAHVYMADNIAMLGNINSVENEECSVVYGYPGDQIDNDCDHKYDEDICTQDDLVTSFYLPYDVSHVGAPIHTEIYDIGTTKHMYLSVITCGLLQIGLRSTNVSSKTAALQVSQTYILLQSCNPSCDQDATVDVSGVSDCASDVIRFKLSLDNDTLKVTVGSTQGQVDLRGLEVDRLLFMSLVRESNVSIDITNKDCGKIIVDQEDNYGNNFVIPKGFDGEYPYDPELYVTNKGTEPVDINVLNKFGDELYSGSVPAQDSIKLTETNYSSTNEKFLRLKSTSGEVSIHAIYSTKKTSLMFLPADVLGPIYHFHYPENTYKHIFLPSVEDRAVYKRNEDVTWISENSINLDGVPATGNMIEAQIPFALFSYDPTGTPAFAQLPPKEFLGQRFFIPAIDLTSLSASGKIYVITTQDSTYCKILGEYHMEYIKDYRDEIIERELYQNEIFEIYANKPVQVMLQINANDDAWGSLLALPHVNQYVRETVLPKLSTEYEIVASYAIADNGTALPSPYSGLPQSHNERLWELAAGSNPFFAMTFVKNTADDTHYILTSDLTFDSNSNRVCVITWGTPGDDIDNDCDNLRDEETCEPGTVPPTPGEIDPDIDASLYEDCQANSSPTINTAPLLDLTTVTATCPPPSSVTTGPPLTSTPVPTPTATVVHNKLSSDWYSGIVFPPLPPSASPPTFEPIVSSGTTTTTPASVTSTQNATTQAPTGTTATTEETCTTDCICPCGWVQEKNYTKEELDELIQTITAKLKVQKSKLSSQLRKKTSAPDDRPSATAVGYVGFTFLITTIGAITLLDITSIIRDLPTEETCTTDCICPCGWVQEKNYTKEELDELIQTITAKLKVQKSKLSSQLRKKTSAPDDRPSATAVGYVGFTFLIITIGAITLLDITSIIRDLRMLRSNLREVFNI